MTRGTARLLSLLVPALLAASVAVGCGGQEASGQELPGRSGQPVVAVTDEVLLPGDQRAPGAPTVTTAPLRLPIARARVPVTRPAPAPRPPGP